MVTTVHVVLAHPLPISFSFSIISPTVRTTSLLLLFHHHGPTAPPLRSYHPALLLHHWKNLFRETHGVYASLWATHPHIEPTFFQLRHPPPPLLSNTFCKHHTYTKTYRNVHPIPHHLMFNNYLYFLSLSISIRFLLRILLAPFSFLFFTYQPLQTTRLIHLLSPTFTHRPWPEIPFYYYYIYIFLNCVHSQISFKPLFPTLFTPCPTS